MFRGFKHTDETKMKMREHHRSKRGYSVWNKGIPMSEGQRLKYSLLYKGKKLPKETCLKMRASKIGHLVSKVTREKISAANKGKKRSLEYVLKMRRAKKIWIKNHPTHIEKMCQAQLNRPTRPESGYDD